MKLIKNLHKLETQKEREEFFDGIWKTPEFLKMALDPQSLVGSIRENYIKQVRYYYIMQNKDLERSAFTSWYSILSVKDYENPYIHDLYVLHELTHQATMPYDDKLSFDDWQVKMRQNEVEASLISEVFIYLERPELRAKSFAFPIWADSFLSDDMVERYAKAPTLVKEEILQKRQNVYDNPQSAAELELANFKKFSYHFYNTWKDDYNMIETNVLNLKAGNDDDYDNFLEKNIGENGILFEDLVQRHYQNYLNYGFKRPHY